MQKELFKYFESPRYRVVSEFTFVFEETGLGTSLYSFHLSIEQNQFSEFQIVELFSRMAWILWKIKVF